MWPLTFLGHHDFKIYLGYLTLMFYSREHSFHFMDEEIEAWILEKYSQPHGTGICVLDTSS